MKVRAFSYCAAGVLLSVYCIGCGHDSSDDSAPTQPVQTIVAAPKTIKPSLTLSGLITPTENVAIASSLVEPAERVSVREGDSVARGEVLAVLATDDLRASLVSAQRAAAEAAAKATQAKYSAESSLGQGNDQVRSAQAALAQAQQTLSQQQSDLARNRGLFAKGYVSDQALQQQTTTVANSEQAVRSAQASLQTALTNARVNGNQDQGLQAANVAAAQAAAASAAAQVDQISAQIARALIRSPLDGVVVNRNLNVGEYPGQRTIFTVQASHGVYAELNAVSADVFRIPAGAPVRLRANGIADRDFSGSVQAVLSQVTPGSTNFNVKVWVPHPGALRPGMVVNATVALPRISGIGIPQTAFLDEAHDAVLCVQNGIAKTFAVREQSSDGVTAIVRGLHSGVRVIANGQLGIVDGQHVAQQ